MHMFHSWENCCMCCYSLRLCEGEATRLMCFSKYLYMFVSMYFCLGFLCVFRFTSAFTSYTFSLKPFLFHLLSLLFSFYLCFLYICLQRPWKIYLCYDIDSGSVKFSATALAVTLFTRDFKDIHNNLKCRRAAVATIADIA